jgi:hypothetical protein
MESTTDNRPKLICMLGKAASGVADREALNRTSMEQTLVALAKAV